MSNWFATQGRIIDLGIVNYIHVREGHHYHYDKPRAPAVENVPWWIDLSTAHTLVSCLRFDTQEEAEHCRDEIVRRLLQPNTQVTYYEGHNGTNS